MVHFDVKMEGVKLFGRFAEPKRKEWEKANDRLDIHDSLFRSYQTDFVYS